ncbi:MAG: amino acid ABC transporter substrate-binding protein [Betaproteobacteria bacterium]|nr:amino acid ABC transporter substrate-binding protein [Betaproteobacteria bacterium]
MLRFVVFFLLGFVVPLWAGAEGARPGELRIVVPDDAAPMAYREKSGRLTGFSVEIARALCEELQTSCVFDVVAQSELLDRLLQGKADMAATGVFETREQRGKLLQASPYFRSFSLWLGPAEIQPGRKGLRVAVVHGSIHEDYARRQGWEILSVRSSGELTRSLVVGEAQAALVPMIGALQMQKSEAFRRLGLAPIVLRAPELGGDISFGISPHRPQLKTEINMALERIKRNGTYDRINSRFLPFRVS